MCLLNVFDPLRLGVVDSSELEWDDMIDQQRRTTAAIFGWGRLPLRRPRVCCSIH